MNSKMLIFGISVLAVGLFAMPSTVSLLSGQHAFIAYEGAASATSCEACHPGVTVSGPHSNGSLSNQSYWLPTSEYTALAADKTVSCRGCHVPGTVNTSLKIPLNSSSVNLTTLSNTTDAHVAVRARCTTCHDRAYSGLTAQDAHKSLNDTATNTSSNITKIYYTDRACITCHTVTGFGASDLSALAVAGNFSVNISRAANGSFVVYYK